MATLYYNAAVDNDWDTLGNWWMDDMLTTQATSLPTSSDSVIATANIYYSNSGPTVVNFTMEDPSGNYEVSLESAITVTGMATFNGSSINGGTVTGNATFNDNAFNNQGTVSGDATFNNNSYNEAGIINGNATFNDNSNNNNGTIDYAGVTTFNNSAVNNGYCLGGVTFNDTSINNSEATTYAIFNDYSCNNYTNMGNMATMVYNDNSYLNDNFNYPFNIIPGVEQIAINGDALQTLRWSEYGLEEFSRAKRGVNGSSLLSMV